MGSKEKSHSIALVSITLVLLLFFVSSVVSAAVVQPINSPFTFTETQITTNASDQYSPYIYGDKIVWTDSGGNFNPWNKDIYMYDLSTSKEIQLTAVSDSTQLNPAIYEDKIVWDDHYLMGSEGWNISVYNLTTSRENKIIINRPIQCYPLIYDDKIVWHDNRNGFYDIYMYNLSTSTETRITANRLDQNDPDIYCDRIVWTDDRNENDDIYMYNVSTSKETQITTNKSDQGWSAIYGDKIVWQDNRNGNPDIYMYDLSIQKETQITTNSSEQLNPDIYGDRIIWEDYRNGDRDIYMYNLSTCEETQVTIDGSAYNPKIYGNRIVWEDYRNGNIDIYMCTLTPKSLIANFSASAVSGDAPLKITFTDKSIGSPTSWKWSFGDGVSSAEKNPVNTYNKVGKYAVNLTVSNEKYTDSRTLEIDVLPAAPPIVDFKANATSGCIPFSVQFTDLSENSTSRKWDFNNDGITDSTEKTPVYVYTFPGTYAVNLTASNDKGIVSRSFSITALPVQWIDGQLILTENQITTNDSEQLNPVIYRDRIVWEDLRGGNPNGIPHIYMYNLSTSQESRITASEPGQGTPAIYGDRIVWTDWRNGNSDIYMYNISSCKETFITTNNSGQSQPAIYGDRIVWQDDRNGGTQEGFMFDPIGNWDIYTYDLSTSIETQITTNSSEQVNPAIYGDRIVWQDHRNGNWDIYTYDLSSQKETQITANKSDDRYPVIYNDKIVWTVWTNDQDGYLDIDLYMYNLSTSEENQITTNKSLQMTPSIYSDRIVWTDDRNGKWDIYMYDLSTHKETQITTNIGRRYSHCPVIYGDKIVWEDDRHGNQDIYMCTVSGEKLKSIFPIANFSSNVTEGYTPLSVRFTDLSQYVTTRTWDFNNDGIADSTEKTPVYVYSVPGIYTVNLTVSNANGSVSKLNTINILTKSNSDGSSSGGSRSSGSGGGGSPESAKNVEVKELCQVFITKGKAIEFDFTKNATCVVYVGFDAKKTVGKTTTIVEQLKNKSTLVSNLTEGEVYKYFNVWVGNSEFASSDNIENSTICFKIEKSWLQDKSIDQDSVTLNRYINKKWEQLPVNLLKEDSKFLYFTADVPGYSFFAVTGKSYSFPAETLTVTYPENDSDSSRDITEITGLEVDSKIDKKNEDTIVPSFEIIYGIACMFGVFIYRRRYS